MTRFASDRGRRPIIQLDALSEISAGSVAYQDHTHVVTRLILSPSSARMAWRACYGRQGVGILRKTLA
jgi:hypothetical protein